MATSVIKESQVRKLFDGKQVTADAITLIDDHVHKNIREIAKGLEQRGRITDTDVDIFINTKLLETNTWNLARDNLIKGRIEDSIEDFG